MVVLKHLLSEVLNQFELKTYKDFELYQVFCMLNGFRYLHQKSGNFLSKMFQCPQTKICSRGQNVSKAPHCIPLTQAMEVIKMRRFSYDIFKSDIKHKAKNVLLSVSFRTC